MTACLLVAGLCDHASSRPGKQCLAHFWGSIRGNGSEDFILVVYLDTSKEFDVVWHISML